MEQVTIPSRKVCLTSEKCSYRIMINDFVIPRNHDITGIILDFPTELSKMNVIIGSSIVASFDHDNRCDLVTFPIYLSLCYYMVAELELVYDHKWLENLEESEMTEEYIEEIEYGDDIEIFDGYDYQIGKLVSRKQVPTGNTVRKITKGVDVMLPSICMNIMKSCDNEAKQVVIRQKIDLKTCDDEYLTRLRTNHNLQVVNDDMGYVNNIIMYRDGFAGLRYIFT